MNILIKLFWEFFKTGLFSIGGGMATVPFLKEMALKTGWFTLNDLADMIAVSESTPGPIGVNTATYVGYKTAGLIGGIVATIGLIAPSIIVILIIARVLDKFRKSKYVEAAFYGLRPASVGLIAAACLNIILIAFFGIGSVHEFASATPVNPVYVVLAAVLLYLTRWCKKTKDLHPIVFLGIAAIVGILV
jgi:chromate transporter